jgi:3-oxoacyl-[acyl-carrier protein] reductase
MDLDLGGKTVWVLGASSGLGRASATSLAWEGASVALSARSEARLKKAVPSLGARLLHDGNERRRPRGPC